MRTAIGQQKRDKNHHMSKTKTDGRQHKQEMNERRDENRAGNNLLRHEGNNYERHEGIRPNYATVVNNAVRHNRSDYDGNNDQRRSNDGNRNENIKFEDQNWKSSFRNFEGHQTFGNQN